MLLLEHNPLQDDNELHHPVTHYLLITAHLCVLILMHY